jgi:hypothetical protein
MSLARSVQPPSDGFAATSPASRGEDNSADWMREARLRAHIERRLIQCYHLLARAHGRAAAWFASADRLALSSANVAAIDEVTELSIDLLKGRVEALRRWRTALGIAGSGANPPYAVQLMESCLRGETLSAPSGYLPRKRAEDRAVADEANLALGAWDGPEEIIKMMEGDRNVA